MNPDEEKFDAIPSLTIITLFWSDARLSISAPLFKI